MSHSPLLTFTSSAFAVEAGEDSATNPGLFGRALAQWLSEGLHGEGVSTEPIVAEDFGWCVPVSTAPHSTYVACSSVDDSRTEWRVFVFAEGGLLARLVGKDRRAESVHAVFGAVSRLLEQHPGVDALREEAP